MSEANKFLTPNVYQVYCDRTLKSWWLDVWKEIKSWSGASALQWCPIALVTATAHIRTQHCRLKQMCWVFPQQYILSRAKLKRKSTALSTKFKTQDNLAVDFPFTG